MVEIKAIVQLEDVHLAQAMNYLEAYKIMVEIKAIVQLEDVHLAQAMNYLEAYKCK
jgi:hypothetical protein